VTSEAALYPRAPIKVAQRGRGKFEARNPKHETNSNDRNSKSKTGDSPGGFGHWNFLRFEFVSDFVLRVSDFWSASLDKISYEQRNEKLACR
jgi:hypothetical protein